MSKTKMVLEAPGKVYRSESLIYCGESTNQNKPTANAAKSTSLIPEFQSNAAKVNIKGLGLKKAYMHKQTNFQVSASEAGNNILFVGLYGPNKPCEEVFIKHMGNNNYNVNYLIKDKGDHVLIVKWGEEHIPGSPYRVEVG